MNTNFVFRCVAFSFVCAYFLSGYCHADDAKKEGQELFKKYWWQFSETSGLDLEAAGKEKKGTLGIGFSLGCLNRPHNFVRVLDRRSSLHNKSP